MDAAKCLIKPVHSLSYKCFFRRRC